MGIQKYSGRNFLTALPTSPLHGQEIVYQTAAMAVLGIDWSFKYNALSGSSLKWETIGGSWWISEDDTQVVVSSAGYSVASGSLPAVTVPLLGDYIIRVGFAGGWGASGQPWMSYSVGGTGALDSDAATAATTAGIAMSVERSRRKNNIAASSAIISNYRTSSASPTVERRYLHIKPIRVG